MPANATFGMLAQISNLTDHGGAPWYMPPDAAVQAAPIDWWFNFILYISLFFFALIIGLMFYFMAAYRRKAGVRAAGPIHHTGLELTWTIIPSLLVIPMFWGGFKSFIDMQTPPADAYDISVEAKQWAWEFVYPNGFRDNELHVPVNTAVKLTMTSQDVLHSLFIPAFRVKQDVVPGRYTKLWFKATRQGDFQVFCSEYCGTSHSDMQARCIVQTAEQFADWMLKANPLGPKNMTDDQYKEFMTDPDKYIREHPEVKNLLPPAQMGKLLWDKKGCKQCHSIEGKVIVGPAWNGIWGKTETVLARGKSATETAVVDENYVRESIVDPQALVVQGVIGTMPTFQGRISDREISMIIAFIKSLGEQKAQEQKK